MTLPPEAVAGAALQLLDTVPDAVVVVDERGTVVFANRRVVDVFGWEPDALVGEQVDVLVPAINRARHQDHVAAYHAAPRVREMGAGVDLSGLPAAGSEFAVEISLAPVPGPERRVIATVRDVSDRRSISNALAAALGHERAAAEELRRASDVRDELLDVAAHELRTPLASISGFVETLTTHWATQDDEWRLAMIERIGVNSQTMLERTERLLDAARLHAGQTEPVLERVDVAGLVRATIASLEELDDRDVQATYDATEITSDRSAITHVITNLLTNAAKYSPPDAPIEVDVRTSQGGVEIAVRDHGVGISAEDLAHVFEHGFRVTASEHVHGSGVGLRVAQQFAEALGGRIEATSIEGEGSTFTAWFPDAG